MLRFFGRLALALAAEALVKRLSPRLPGSRYRLEAVLTADAESFFEEIRQLERDLADLERQTRLITIGIEVV